MKESVLTIGKFDGVHAGHAYLLAQVASLAKERGLQPAVMTFDPHPVCVIAPGHAPRPLISLEERCARIRGLGIEEVFILPFTLEISRLSPEEFVSRYVRGQMRARVVMVGRDFRFGYKQAGDPAVLTALGERYGFETRLVEAVKLRGLIVSASEIRRRIEAGDVALAGRLLGRPYTLAGEVVAGQGIGSRQTVPTLNLHTAGGSSAARWSLHYAHSRSRSGTLLEFDHQHRHAPHLPRPRPHDRDISAGFFGRRRAAAHPRGVPPARPRGTQVRDSGSAENPDSARRGARADLLPKSGAMGARSTTIVQ